MMDDQVEAVSEQYLHHLPYCSNTFIRFHVSYFDRCILVHLRVDIKGHRGYPRWHPYQLVLRSTIQVERKLKEEQYRKISRLNSILTKVEI